MKTPTNTGESPILSLRIPPDVLAQLDTLSKRTGISRSSLVRTALKRGLKNLEQMASVLEQDT